MNQAVDPKIIYKEKMQLAIENLKLAETEGAEAMAPDTYVWAKQKIYESKKIILQYADDEKKVEEAVDVASAAAAKLLATVRRHLRCDEKESSLPPEQIEQEAIKVLVNEGGPVK
jgi:hypothetical protein